VTTPAWTLRDLDAASSRDSEDVELLRKLQADIPSRRYVLRAKPSAQGPHVVFSRVRGGLSLASVYIDRALVWFGAKSTFHQLFIRVHKRSTACQTKTQSAKPQSAKTR
jgi:hypothetical protein